MDLKVLEQFFFWSMVVNLGIYMVTAIAVVALRDFVYKVQKKLFGLDDEAVAKATLNYLGNFKLLITFFNVTPWIVILIMK